MNFRQLIDREARYTDPARRPRTMAAMAKKCGVGRAALYRYFSGDLCPPSWRIESMAKGLGVPAETVQRALNKTQTESLTL